MKTFYSILTACFLVVTLNAQSFEDAIQKGLNDFSTSNSPAEMIAVANYFERVSMAESGEWLPAYYSAQVYTILCFMTPDVAEKEIYLEKAQQAVDRAMKIEAKNSEIHTMQGMLYQAYIGLDPATNGMIYSGKANTSFEFAKKYDETNPRPIYLQAISIMHTPQQYGGGSGVACPMFTQAAALFDSFQPKSDIAPNWGKEDCQNYLNQCSDVANVTQ